MMIPLLRGDAMTPDISRWYWILVLLASLLLAGCQKADKENAPSQAVASKDALTRLRLAVGRQDWQAAEDLSATVLLQYHDNADAIELAARAAHGSGNPDIAANLMLDACHVESFSSPTRANQAAAALLAVGRIYDCMDLLESAVAAQPDQHELRRMLYQMYWGVEDRPRSVLHGRYLVRQRQFDMDLLLAMTATESRVESSDAFVEMAARHPADKRPLIAEARIQFDRRNFEQAATILRDCLQHHPTHSPAIAILSRVLVDSGKDDEYLNLVSSSPKSVESYPFYWLAKGDWCRAHNQYDQAARAYWEATRLDADLRMAWLKLSAALIQLGPEATKLDPEQVAAVDKRVILLSRFSQTKAQFVKSDKRSRKLAIDLAETLQALGRFWEAEAWASIATTLPNDDQLRPVNEVRQAIVDSLRRDTPWQNIESHPELQIDLTSLPLPQIGRASNVVKESNRDPMTHRVRPHQIQMINEAEVRSLNFFGRTADDLDKPGIRFFRTLGCGGGTIDYDLDGWSDLYLAAAGGTPPHRDSQSNTLWRNLRGTFQNVTPASGSSDTGFGQGVAVGDLNEDGFPDLVVLNYGPNTLFINNGDGTFTDASRRMANCNPEFDWSSSAAIADLNDDGLSDLTILTYVAGLEPVTRECLHSTKKIARACSPLVFAGALDHFLYGTSQGDFVDRTAQCGAPSVVGRGLGLSVGSFDGEPGMDIFIANDATSNHYWNRPAEGGSLLIESATVRGLATDERTPAQGSMGIATGDLDRDGDLDLYVTNFSSEANTYLEQQQSGFWRDQTSSLSLIEPTEPMVGFGTEAIDLDNDGLLELVVANGHVDMYPSDKKPIPYAQAMQIFRRNRNHEFISIGESINSNYLSTPHVGRALWTIDANRDGRSDLVVTHQTEPVALLINHSENSGNWIAVKLIGRDCSRDAIGAVVEVRSADQHWTTPLMSGDGFLCSNDRLLRIGIGDVSNDCEIVVTWPDGSRQSFQDLKINCDWLLVQNDEQAFRLSD
jgi:tetratricopeptide (TPR) repeat protein